MLLSRQPFDHEIGDLLEVAVAGDEGGAEALGERGGDAVGVGDAVSGFEGRCGKRQVFVYFESW